MLKFGCCLSYFICSIRSIKPDWFAPAILRYIQVRWGCCPYLRGQFREQTAWRKESLGLNSAGRICSPLRSVQSKLFLPLGPFLTLWWFRTWIFVPCPMYLPLCSTCALQSKACSCWNYMSETLGSLRWRPNVGASSDIQAPRLMGIHTFSQRAPFRLFLGSVLILLSP